jgi:LPS export ABC transporter protein LptC
VTALGHVSMVLAGVLTACVGAPVDSSNPTAARADQVILGASYALTHDGGRRGVVNADSAFVEQSTLTADLRQIRVTAFSADGQLVSTLTAPRGELRIGGDSVRLSGGVTAITPIGDTLRTPRLLFDQGALRLVTDTTFTLSSRAGNRTGTGLTTDFRLRSPGAGGGR